MAEIEKKVIIQVETGDSVKKVKEVEEGVKNLDKQQKTAKTGTKGLQVGFAALGATMKAAGIGLVLAGFTALSAALMKNQEIADTTATVFNGIGVAFKLVSDTLVSVVKRVAETKENFDGLTKIIQGIIGVALFPLKLQFNSLRGGLLALQLAWESSWLGGGDEVKIEKIQGQLKEVGENLKDATIGQFQNIADIVTGSVEAVSEVSNIIEVAAEETEKTFKDVTVNTITEQAKLLTEISNTYELLGAKQQRLIEQYDRDAELQRQIRDDVSLTMEERIAANERLGEILDDQVEAEKGAVQLQIDALNKRVELEGESHQLTKELFDLNTELIAIEAKVTGFRAEQLTNTNALLKEQGDLQRQNADDMKKLAKEAKEEKEAEEDAAFSEAMKRIDLAQSTLNSLADIRQEGFKKEQIELDKQLKKGLITQEEYDKASRKLEKESLKAEKKNAMFQILVDTAQGVAGAIKAGSGLIFPKNLAAILTGVASVMSGIATAKGILNQVPGGGGGGDTTTGAIGGVGNVIPNIDSIVSPDADIQPVQAFVIENDISDAQALQEELDIQATL